MTTVLLNNTALAKALPLGIASQKSILKANNNRLVARWLLDDNSKLYCQWEKQNCGDRCYYNVCESLHYD